MELWLNYLDQILIFVTFAVSLNLLLGYAGQVSVAHAAFGGIGGYTIGYMMLSHGWNIIPALVVGMVFSFVIGWLLGLPALRLSVEFLILLTLAAGLVIVGVISTFPVMGGVYGLVNIPRPSVLGFHMRNPRDFVIPLAVIAAIVFALCHRMGESPYGRVLRALRDDDRVTESLGKNVVGYKLSVFAITSAMAGLAGGLYSGYLSLATPGLYGFDISLKIFAIVIFGGMANLTGSIIGEAVVVLTQPLLEHQPLIHLDARQSALGQLIIYGFLLVILMMWRPEGVLPEGFSLWRWLRGDRGAGKRVEMSDETWVPDIEVRELANKDEATRDREWRESPVVLEVRGLSKRFGGIIAADSLDLELRRGTITSLVGPNGAGKTTVFNLLTGFIRPDAGSVKLNGEELVGLAPFKIAQRGMVRSFQDVRIVPRLSVLENVMLGVQDQPGEHLDKLFLGGNASSRGEDDTREKALGWLRFVGMGAFADVPGAALSYGQSKLVSLARVLATEADVLLLDEPASGVDTKWVDTLLDLVLAVKEQGRTVCIVEHNLHVVGRLADHTYFMELGRITAEGTISELTASERLAEAYFGSAGAATGGAPGGPTAKPEGEPSTMSDAR
jgi:branched-chain amino acid transport system permease protein